MLQSAQTTGLAERQPPGFAVREPQSLGDVVTIAVEGELDLATAPLLKESLVDTLRDGGREVILDLSGVTFIDSTALGALVDAQRRWHHDAPLSIVCAHLNVLRIFKIISFQGTFEIFATLEKALAHARRGGRPRL